MTDCPLLNRLNRVLILLALVVAVAGFFLVPLESVLPIHWNIAGEPDNFAPAPLALSLPAIMALVVVGLLFVLRPAGLARDLAAGRHLIDATISFILALAIVLYVATIAIGLGVPVDMPRVIAFLIGAMLLVIGNYLPKTQPNWIAGIRLPWTLCDPANWAVTHRWAGRLMILAGFALFLAAMLSPPTAMLIVLVVAAVGLPIIASVIISYAMARR